ncbi:MAG: branched-chain amino acid ABC transporter permease [Spirochaetales bacterium]|nr:branched-chain amino acid ABC transporter permease [Spirochaetales bacterium]
MIFSLIIDGLAVGSVYALVAAGLVMLVKSTGALNFAHGDFMMFSTFVAYALLVQFELPFWVAVIGSLSFAALLGMIAERLVIRKLMNGPMSGIIMGTLGMAYILQGIAKMIWTDDIFIFPEFFPGDYLKIGSALISPQSLGVIVSAVIIISGLYFFLNMTKTGTGLRALTQNKTAATLMGIKVTRVYSISWAVGGGLAGFAGILLAPALFLSTGMGSITFTCIIAAIIGGFGNIFGAIIGGYILGVFSAVIPVYIPTELQGMIPFVLLMLILFIKPTGILGKKTVKKV